MKNRLLFHLFHFVILNALVYTAVYIYFALEYGSGFILYSFTIAYKFIANRWLNFLVITVAFYVLNYLAGVIKFTLEDKTFSFVDYFKQIFLVLLILGMVSFSEFFAFYQSKIGRLIYFYLFILYTFYYLIYLKVRSYRGRRWLTWMAQVSPAEVFEKYIKANNTYSIVDPDHPPKNSPFIEVVYQEGNIDEQTSEDLIKNKLAGYPVVELVELVERETGKIPLDYVNVHWFLEKFQVVDRNYFRSSRFFNVFAAFILLVLLFPLGLLVALLHRCFSRGPIFFIQQRIGLHGKPFNLIKFRTMVTDAEKSGASFAGVNDPRITRIGRFMRRFRLDEIPQFVNVLKGDMSLVGPRPEREVFIEKLAQEIPYYRLRLLVHPGLTGWAQINGAYAGHHSQEHKEKLEFDLYYIKNRSIFMDLSILIQTVKTIFQGKGH